MGGRRKGQQEAKNGRSRGAGVASGAQKHRREALRSFRVPPPCWTADVDYRISKFDKNKLFLQCNFIRAILNLEFEYVPFRTMAKS
jgi:hypothetical protein